MIDMPNEARIKIRNFIEEKLHAKGDVRAFLDSDSLFVSRRLDSLNAMETVVLLEESFGVNFVKMGFDQMFIDTVDLIVSLIEKSHKI